MASHIKPTSKQEPAGTKHYHTLQVVLSVLRVLGKLYAYAEATFTIKKTVAIKTNLCYN